MKILGYVGSVLIFWAVADFALSFFGINTTPFLPPTIGKFSPIILGVIGGALLNIANKK